MSKIREGITVLRDLVWTLIGLLILAVLTLAVWKGPSLINNLSNRISSISDSAMQSGAGGIGLYDFTTAKQNCIKASVSADRFTALQSGEALTKDDIDNSLNCFTPADGHNI